MPIKADGPGTTPAYDSVDDGFTWIAHPEETMQRASQALVTGDGVWLVDPLDADGLDDRIAEYGDVAGVAILVDRHERDAAAIATRHEVPVTRPPGIGRAIDAPTRDVTDGLPGTGYAFLTVQNGTPWQEVGLWNGTTMVVPESLGTNAFSRAGDERVGLNPAARLFPPRHLSEKHVEQLLVGHGRPLLDDVTPSLRGALTNARRRLPRALLDTAKALL